MVTPCTTCLFCYAGKRGDWVLDLVADLVVGLTVEQAKEKYGVSQKTVTKVRGLAGLRAEPRLRVTTPDKLGRAQELLESGSTYREAAKSVGMKPKTLAYHLPGYGLQGKTKANVEKAKPMLDDGVSYEEVARTLNIGKDTLRRYLPGYTFTPKQIAERAAIGRMEARIFATTNPIHARR